MPEELPQRCHVFDVLGFSLCLSLAHVFPSGRGGHRAIREDASANLEALASVDEAAVKRLPDEDEQGFLANMLVVVHEQPAVKVLPRPSLAAAPT